MTAGPAADGKREVPKAVFMFSGQGSQYFHMGRGLFEGCETFRTWMVRLDGMVSQYLGCSVLEALYSDKRGKGDAFDRTRVTHPALFMVEYALARTLCEAGLIPGITLGASIGAAAAATLSGCLEIEDAICLVAQQALSVEETCGAGAMIAVLADSAMFAEPFLSTRSELAGVNLPSHFVVSCAGRHLGPIEFELAQRAISYQRLPVAFGFHSSHIDPARESFLARTRDVRFREAVTPMMCCERASLVSRLPADYFWRVVRNPMRFAEAVLALERQGPHLYIDVGPSGTLATFLKYLLPRETRSAVRAVLTPFGRDLLNLSSILSARCG